MGVGPVSRSQLHPIGVSLPPLTPVPSSLLVTPQLEFEGRDPPQVAYLWGVRDCRHQARLADVPSRKGPSPHNR